MGLVRGDVVDARMVMLGVVPGKVPAEIGAGGGVIEESAGILRCPFDRAEGRLDERIVVGCSGAGKELGHAMILTEPLNRFGFHLAAPIVNELGPLVLGQVQDILFLQTSLQQEPGLPGRLLPADAPLDGFAGPFVQQQVEVKVDPFLVGHQVADIPTPALVGAGQILADRSFGVAVVSAAGTACGHQVLRFEDAINGGEGGLEDVFVPGRDRQDAMGQVGIFGTFGQRHNLVELRGQHPMPWFSRSRRPVGQALSPTGLLLPAHDAAVGDHQNHAGAAHRDTLL
jgi:hypothetical protein